MYHFDIGKSFDSLLGTTIKLHQLVLPLSLLDLVLSPNTQHPTPNRPNAERSSSRPLAGHWARSRPGPFALWAFGFRLSGSRVVVSGVLARRLTLAKRPRAYAPTRKHGRHAQFGLDFNSAL